MPHVKKPLTQPSFFECVPASACTGSTLTEIDSYTSVTFKKSDCLIRYTNLVIDFCIDQFGEVKTGKVLCCIALYCNQQRIQEGFRKLENNRSKFEHVSALP